MYHTFYFGVRVLGVDCLSTHADAHTRADPNPDAA